MGHANLENFGVALIELLKKKPVSIKEASCHCKKNKIFFHASEGMYDDLYMINMGITEQMFFLLQRNVVVPVTENEQAKLLCAFWKAEKLLTFSLYSCTKKAALESIYLNRVPGWWHYKEKYVEVGICTAEEFDKVLGRK